MLPYLSRVQVVVLVLFLAFVNCAFVAVDKNGAHNGRPSTNSLVIPAESKPQVKKVSFLNRLRHKLSIKPKNGKGLVALAVVGTILVSIILALGLYMFAFAGASGTLLALVGIVGFALIIFAAARIIRGVKRRQRTAHLNPNKDGGSGIVNTVLQ